MKSTKKEIKPANAPSQKPYKIGFTSVVGDLLHLGHLAMLDECKQYCDFLYCGLICDPTKDRPEKNKPVESVFERYYRIVSHRAVDEVIPLEGEEDLELAIKSLPINVRFVGEDYKDKEHTGRQLCADLGIPIIYNKRRHGRSSTSLRTRIEENKTTNKNAYGK